MFIRSLFINDFRLFQEKNFKIGKYVTAIAGYNTTGKSTILGLLGQCGELKKKYKPLLHSSFRSELSLLLKFSHPYDDNIPNIGTITFEDVPHGQQKSMLEEIISYRSTWQKYRDGKRYRILPKKTTTRRTEKKIPWPILYLGLGRLYPVGESVIVEKSALSKRLTPEENAYLLRHMDSILSTDEHAKDITAASIAETSKKKAVGINTDRYNYLCNSAGQDNLGQILLSILSFKRLKEELGVNWNGGLLLIDELDATLHPFSQNKLVKHLYDEAKEIGMQVVFTTHSLSLLDFISVKTSHNDSDAVNNYELIYVRNANRIIEVIMNPTFEALKNDLMPVQPQIGSRKVSVFSEDNEARYFINKLLTNYSRYIELLDVSLGQNQLLDLLVADYNHFSRYLYILDGDVKEEMLSVYRKRVAPAKLDCVMKLPGDKSPEAQIWEYLITMPSDHPFLEWTSSNMEYSHRNFEENGPFSGKYDGCEDRIKYKRWFNDNIQLISDVFDYWQADKAEMIEYFIKDFKVAFDWTAKKSFIPAIRD